VIIGAGDTFRAAAAEQLQIWGERAGAEVIRHAEGADPGAVAFDAARAAVARGPMSCCWIRPAASTTKVNLMEELKKVRRVLAREIPGAPHETWLVLDATTGQNALSQARIFRDAVGSDRDRAHQTGRTPRGDCRGDRSGNRVGRAFCRGW